MADRTERFQCNNCRARFNGNPRKTFLGFRRFQCEECGREVLYPLSSGYRTFYWIVVGFMALVTVVSLSQGKIALPGCLGIAAIVALGRDSEIRKTLAMSLPDRR